MNRSPSFDLAARRLYLCTGVREDLARFVSETLQGGVDVIQLREKHADARTIIHHAKEIKQIAHDFNVPFFINDRPDIALEVGADGVHVGQDDVDVDLVRRIIPGALVGLSTHDPGELQGSLLKDVDYISAGPISATPTKPGRAGTGIGYAEQASLISPRPVFVTGGVQPGSIRELVARGIRHFVVVRYLTEASDPRLAAKMLRTAIDEALAS
ncbi:MAG: thiamine phosphate synthase [Actinomycetota bacterium]|nr:MAG: thiamine phosphate synthase [Actinomycetota bacterium]